jgi:hypothetical protein
MNKRYRGIYVQHAVDIRQVSRKEINETIYIHVARGAKTIIEKCAFGKTRR